MVNSRWLLGSFWLSVKSSCLIFAFVHSPLHLRWLKLRIDIGGATSTKLQKQATSILICQVHHLGKSIFVPRGLRPPRFGSFEHLQGDFLQLPLSIGHQFVLVIVCVFPCELKLSPATGWWPHSDKVTVRKCVSHSGYTFHDLQWSRHPLRWVNHTSLQTLMKALQALCNYHCPSHSRAPGKVEGADRMLKLEIFKPVETTGLPWLKVLTLVLPTLGNINSLCMRQSLADQYLFIYNPCWSLVSC